MSAIDNIIRKHMEAMHDEIYAWLRNEKYVARERRTFDSPEAFANTVIREIDGGTMYSSGYVDWYNEEVGQ